ncbi:ATP-binding protein [Candidatus Albibeggiatoa sp. nov. NOAA]|uniref:ATP-binding protein n=1 Tax=Candidatus Albibeggiatoa sp. nov. NOAA TaxID=3162724 RepID=UPI0032FF1CD0|nr:ATP-binding protein [Thiotrichaceae bacterium]
MKISLTRKKPLPEPSHQPPWKILVVDDDADVRKLAHLNLKGFEFEGRTLQFFDAKTAQEAREVLEQEPDIAVALIDVVMETEDAGLKLVEHIRYDLHNHFIRLIIRTGQPGVAPERTVIDNYDIDDYKDKTELTAQKLYTAMRSALKSYRDLLIIDSNRRGLQRILDTTPSLYKPQNITEFFDNVLQHIIDLCQDNFIATITNSILLTSDNSNNNTEEDENNQQVVVQSATGRFKIEPETDEVENIKKMCVDCLLGIVPFNTLPDHALLVPLNRHGTPVGFIYLEEAKHLGRDDRKLMQIMANQCAAALENLQLYIDVKEAHRQSLNSLAMAEKARVMAEAANKAKSTFLAQMSHELRTPLNAILGYSDFIYEDAEDIGYDYVLPYLEDIRNASLKLLAMISDILDISQIETGNVEIKLTEYDMNDLTEELIETVEPMVRTNGNKLVLKGLEGLGSQYADKTKVKQILLNLLNNAAKFTQRGKVLFTASRQSKVMYGEEEKRDWFCFQVSDTGIGIPLEKMERIFEAFGQVDNSSTREYDGTGLGLAISQHYSQIMGGHITVDSDMGKGSTFTVWLPATVEISAPKKS